MSKPHPAPRVEVDDAAAAIEKARELGRRILAVPKKKIDQKLLRKKSGRERLR